jgi:hypothetical protein
MGLPRAALSITDYSIDHRRSRTLLLAEDAGHDGHRVENDERHHVRRLS